MGRIPGETTEQWFLRATANYQQAWDALTVAARRRDAAGHPYPNSLYPLGDEPYDAAMDDLDAADNDRTEASVTLDRERHPG